MSTKYMAVRIWHWELTPEFAVKLQTRAIQALESPDIRWSGRWESGALEAIIVAEAPE